MDLAVKVPPPHSPVVTSGDQDWKPVQTCSFVDPATGASIWWLLRHVRMVGIVGGMHPTRMLSCRPS